MKHAVCAALLCLLAPAALAQADFPNRSIKIIVPVPAGSAADLLARIYAKGLQDMWGQPVVVENRVGASHNIGADVFARSAPDGYTLFAAPPPSFVINQYLFPKLPYDATQFVPLTVMAEVPNVLVVRPGLKVSSVADLVAMAKANPGKLTYGSTGKGSTLQLAAEMFRTRAGIDLLHIPYTGVPQLVSEMLADRIDMAFINLVDVYSHAAHGPLKPLAVALESPSPELPGIPTVGETYPGFVSTAWFATAAPPKTEPAMADRLYSAIRKAFEQPEAAALMKSLHATPILQPPQQTRAFIDADRLRYREVIEANHIRAD